MFGLDLSFVILVPERKRGIDTGIQGIFDSLFDLDVRVKPEHDNNGAVWMSESSPMMTLLLFFRPT